LPASERTRPPSDEVERTGFVELASEMSNDLLVPDRL
jgi:hypothetical protein